MSSGGSYWYKERRGRDGKQVVHNPVEHGCIDLHPPFLESIPMESGLEFIKLEYSFKLRMNSTVITSRPDNIDVTLLFHS